LASSPTAHFAGVETKVAGCSSECFGVAVDTSGNVYIADTYNNRVLKESLSAGGYTQSVIATGLNKPYGVAVDLNGNIYVADSFNKQVVKETLSSGTYTPSIIASDLPTTPFNVAVDNSGNVYVPEGNSVLKLTPSGSSYIQSVVAGQSSGLQTPSEVAVDSHGNVYVTDSGTNSVYKETPSGSSFVQTTVATGLDFPTGVTVDSQGNVYIANSYTNQVLMESPSSGGTYTQTVYATGTLQSPYEIAADTQGNLYIANPQAFSILKETPGSVDFGLVNVGTESTARNLVFAFDSAEAITMPSVVTQGASNLDFGDAGSGSCTTNGTSLTYSVGQTCTLNVVFHPTASGFVPGAAVLTDHVGNQIAVAYLHGTGVSPQVNFLPGTQTTLPSNGLQGPSEIAVDAAGNVFFIDGNNVMKESYSGGQYTLSTLFSNLSSPFGLALDGAGNIYIAETTGRTVIRETPYSGGYYQSLTISPLSLPTGLAVDGKGNLFIADLGASRVYEVSPITSGFTSSSIGSDLQSPFTIAVDGAGAVYIGDGTDGKLTVETPGKSGYSQSVVTLPDTVVTSVATDIRGNLYTSDQAASTVLKWTPSSGTYVQSNIGTSISYPIGIAVDRSGNVFVANEGSSQVLKVDFADPPALNFASSTYLTPSGDSPKSITLENIGNAILEFSTPSSGQNPSISSSFTIGDNASDCPVVGSGSSAASLSAGSSCDLSISFVPQTVGSISGSLVISDSVLNGNPSSQRISLAGIATQASPEVTWSSPAAITYGTVLSSTQLNATGNVPGNFTYSPALGSVLKAGNQTLLVTFTPTDAADYTTATATVPLVVNPAAPTITWPAPAAIVYGTALSAAQLNPTAPVPGNFTYSPALGTVLKAGSQKLLATFTPTDTADYSTVTANVTLTVNPAAPTITWPAPAAIVYGTAVSAAQLNATAPVPGNFTYSPALGTVLKAGSQKLSATFTPTDAADYTTATANVTLTVNPAAPTITWQAPAAIVYGTALSAAQLNATSSVPGTFTYSPAAGTTPALGTIKLSVAFIPTDAANYATASASVDLSVINPLPILSALSPAVATAGGSAFTLTVSGSGFDPNSVVYWGTTALSTQFVSGTQLTAQVAVSSIATSGTTSVVVQTPTPGGGNSGTMQFEIDSANSTGPPQFSVQTATVTAGSSANYPMTLPSSASNVTVTCLNLPAGASCSYSASTSAVAISTSSTTPVGTYQIIIVFTETLPGAAAAWIIPPFLLLPLASARRKFQLHRTSLILIGAVALAATVFGITACGGSSGGSSGSGAQTHQITSSGAVTLNVQ
jgi:sugar lactone lactonase YvrE